VPITNQPLAKSILANLNILLYTLVFNIFINTLHFNFTQYNKKRSYLTSQFIGSEPLLIKILLHLLKGLLPKKPYLALNGLGCALSII